jgi:hypothetical protein
MRSAAVALAVSFTVAAAVSAQPRPDFSGTWRLDVNRSNSAAHSGAPRPVTLEITQNATEISIRTITEEGASTLKYAIAQTEAPTLATTTGAPTARWNGTTLTTDAIRDIRGQSVTVQQSRQLSADGNEMTVDSIVNVQHGYSLSGAQTYGASRDIFVRVR